MHAVGVIDPVTGGRSARRPRRPGPRCSARSWPRWRPSAPDVVAITAAMLRAHRAGSRSPRSSRTGSSTSASPSSTRSPPPPAWPWAALHPVVCRVRDVPQPRLRPAADGRRAAPAAGDVRAGPGRRHRRRTGRPTTACGTCPCCRLVPGLRVAAPRDAATGCAELLREAVGVTDGPTAVRFPKGTRRPTIPAVGPLAVSTCCTEAERPRTCCWSASARWPGVACRPPRGWPTQGLGVHRRRPALGQPGQPGAGRAGRPAPAGGHRRGQRPGRRRRRGRRAGAARRRRRRRRCAPSGCRSAFLDHGKPRRGAGRRAAWTRRPRRLHRTAGIRTESPCTRDRTERPMTGIALGLPAAPAAGAGRRARKSRQLKVGDGPGRRRRAGLGAVDDHHPDRRRRRHAAADRRADRGRLRHRPGRGAVTRTTPRRCRDRPPSRRSR